MVVPISPPRPARKDSQEVNTTTKEPLKTLKKILDHPYKRSLSPARRDTSPRDDTQPMHRYHGGGGQNCGFGPKTADFKTWLDSGSPKPADSKLLSSELGNLRPYMPYGSYYHAIWSV